LGRTLSLSPWDRRTRGTTNSYLHTALNKQETPLGESKLNILFPDLQRVRCVDSIDQSMLSTGHRHRVTDALNETHAHLAPRKHTEACKVELSVTPGGFYCESFYVLPPQLLPVRLPRVIVHGLIWTGNGVMVTMRTYSKWLAIVYSMLTPKGLVQNTSLTSKRCHTNLSAM
jgi:hypothetical protein